MKKTSYLLLAFGLLSLTANAQIKPEKFNPFIGGQTIVSSSGTGLTADFGDILLELKDQENPDFETLMLLRNTKGKLTKIAENSSLLMGKELLGVSGGNYPELSGNKLSVDYTTGSNSSQSDVSITFEKNSKGEYEFKEYTSLTRNYGVENLFARQQITVQQTGKISFDEADENRILKNAKSTFKDPYESLQQATQLYKKYIYQGYQLAAFAEGNLNADDLKKDLVLVFNDDKQCMVRLLLQQKDGTYKTAQSNNALIAFGGTFNAYNLKTVIKNGYFTIEQRVPDGDMDFDHRFITFKYDAAQKDWYLHRYDVEHFSGFNPKPVGNTTHLTQENFGKILFKELDYTPGDYGYDPAVATISGTLTEKQFYGRPNYGETPDKDEKVTVFILKPDYPVNVLAAPNQPDSETADKTIRNITGIQAYSTNKNEVLSKKLNQKVTLKGVLFIGRSGGHYTKVVMEVRKIAD